MVILDCDWDHVSPVTALLRSNFFWDHKQFRIPRSVFESLLDEAALPLEVFAFKTAQVVIAVRFDRPHGFGGVPIPIFVAVTNQPGHMYIL